MEKILERLRSSRLTVVGVVFSAYFLDNVLMTVIVPIIPNVPTFSVMKGSGPHNATPAVETVAEMDSDDERIGFLFASKSIVQLLANPVVGYLTSRYSYMFLMSGGSATLTLSALVYAMGSGFGVLLFARCLHGIGSSLSLVTGMALLSDTFSDDAERSKYAGMALGGMGVGVLIGYPFGGVMHEFVGNAAPFLILAVLMGLIQVMQFLIFEPFKHRHQSVVVINTSAYKLLGDPYILVCLGSIGFSTTAIATLEPCLPMWLKETIKPQEWQLGTAFLPDSFGYLIGTNVFGIVALRIGRWICATASMLTVGFCLILIPFSTEMVHLIGPHFGIGLGVATIDASLMPLLAHLVDTRHEPTYGAVFALVQTTVCLAYSIGPFLGGYLVTTIGFPWLLRGLALINICYAPLNAILRRTIAKEENQGLLAEDELGEDAIECSICNNDYGATPTNNNLPPPRRPTLSPGRKRVLANEETSLFE